MKERGTLSSRLVLVDIPAIANQAESISKKVVLDDHSGPCFD
jgi:hypothetical protein